MTIVKFFVSNLLALLALGLFATPVHAQQVTRPVTLEYFQGPVVSSNRLMGMGGAFIGVAEGADAHLINPASFATRYSYTANDWFDYDWALSWVTMPEGGDAALNTSPVSINVDRASYAELGFDLKFGRLGVGFHGAPHTFDERLGWTDPDEGLRVAQVTWTQMAGGVGLGYAFIDGQLIVGLASQTTLFGVEGTELERSEVFTLTSTHVVWGALLAPRGEPWRLGLRYRTPSDEDTVTGSAETFQLRLQPERVVAPWEIGVGGSWRFGQRQYNPRYKFDDEGATAEQEDDRRYMLVAADLILTGTTDQAIGIESFLAQQYARVGETVSLGARAGVESEVVANLLRLRAGSYYEPSRYESYSGRFHATAGADLRVKLGWEWRLNTAVDLAPGYLNWGLGVGFWH